jgi:mycothiol synthase
MTTNQLDIRTFTWPELDAFAGLLTAIAGKDQSSAAEVTEQTQRLYRRPGLTPERDCFLAWQGADLVGYLFLIAEEPINRGVIERGAHPRHRGQGIGDELLKTAIAHARVMHYDVIHANVTSDATAPQRLFSSAGFTQVKELWHLRRDSDQPASVDVPEGYQVRVMNADEGETLTQLQNATFTGTWGFCPNTPEQVAYGLNDLFPSLLNTSLFLDHEGKTVGYCWIRQSSSGDPSYIEMVGVHPDFRGKGLAKVVTGAGIDYLVGKGLAPIGISVLGDNTPAVRTYEGLGFQVHERAPWYELRLS